MNLIKKHLFFYATICVFVVLELLFLFSIIPPQISSLINNWQDLLQTSKEVTNLNGVNIALTTQNKESIAPYLTRARVALPDEKKSAGFIAGFTKFASSYGVSVVTADFSPGLVSSPSASTNFLSANSQGDLIVSGGVKAISVTATAVSDPTSLKGFFDALRHASQIVDVSQTEYFASDKGNNTVKISLLVYFQPQNPSTINWEDVKTLNEDDINFLGALPTVDQFKLPTE